jgi:ATP-dependent Lhr-like helicase
LLAEFLVGMGRKCRIAEARIEKEQIVDVFSPIRRDPYPPSGYTGARLYAELSQLIRSRQSVIVFTNVRSAAEQIGLRLREHLPELADAIEIHHASLDRSVRLAVEDRLKNGELRAVVCSTSLELGIDIGAVDLVVMVATPKGVSRAIQRIGRSGHSLNKSSHGILVATNVNDLVEATVTAKLVRERALDPIKILEKPFDVVAQHIVELSHWRRRRPTPSITSSSGRDHFTTSPTRSSIGCCIIWRAGAKPWRNNIVASLGKSPSAMMELLLWQTNGWRANS